ncbi:MAG: MoxR family ATPase [Dehalococcoidales bacterium]|nr:MoxR family ATPase [Dehalococcoidales bacterium]
MADTKKVVELYQKILAEVSKAIISKNEIKEALMLALIAGGHVLIEGLTGTAKTKLGRSFAEVVGGKFKRIQFTPDMMPADVTGFYAYSLTSEPRFIEGPIFANIVLADELNRTTPRTQSALLEAMQEYQVTIEKKTYLLDKPFMVIATQVQSGAEGTYPLTDVQIDRFMLRIWSEYATKEEEKQIIGNIDQIDEPNIRPVTTLDEIKGLQELARSVHVSPQIVDYTVSIVDYLRSDPDVLSGPSIRAGIALFKCSRVLALLDERDFVIPDDIKHLVPVAVEHRIKVKPEAEMDDVTPRVILERALERIPVPK